MHKKWSISRSTPCCEACAMRLPCRLCVSVFCLLLLVGSAASDVRSNVSMATHAILGLLPRFGHAVRTPLLLCDRFAVFGTDRGVVGRPVHDIDDSASPSFFDALPGLSSLHLISPHRLLALAGSTVALYRCESAQFQRVGKFADRSLIFNFDRHPASSFDEPHFQPLRIKTTGANTSRFVVLGTRSADRSVNASMVVAFDEDLLQMEWAAVAPGHTSAFPVQASSSSLWMLVGNVSGSLAAMKLRGSIGKVLPTQFDTGLRLTQLQGSSQSPPENFVVVSHGEMLALSSLGLVSLARVSWRNADRFAWVVRQHKLHRCSPTLPPVRFLDAWFVFCGASTVCLSTDLLGRRPPSAAHIPPFLVTSSPIAHYKVISTGAKNTSQPRQSFLVILAGGEVLVVRGGPNNSVTVVPSSPSVPSSVVECVGVESAWLDGALTLIVPCTRSPSGGSLLLFRLSTTLLQLVRVCELEARPLGSARVRHGSAGLRIFLPTQSSAATDVVVGLTQMFLTGRDAPAAVATKPGLRSFFIVGAHKAPRQILLCSNCTATLVHEVDGERALIDTCQAFGSQIWETVRVTSHRVLLFLASRADIVVAVSFGSSPPVVEMLRLCDTPSWWSRRSQDLYRVSTAHRRVEVLCSGAHSSRRQAVVLYARPPGDAVAAWTVDRPTIAWSLPMQADPQFAFSRWIRVSHFRDNDDSGRAAADRLLLVVLNESVWVCKAQRKEVVGAVPPSRCSNGDEVLVRYSHSLGIRLGAWCRGSEPQYDDDRGLLLFLDLDGWLNAMPVTLGRVLWRSQHFHARHSPDEAWHFLPSTLAQFCGAQVFFRNHNGLVIAVDALTGLETRVFGGSARPVVHFDFVGFPHKQHSVLYTLHDDGHLWSHRLTPHRAAHTVSGMFPRDCVQRSHLEVVDAAKTPFVDVGGVVQGEGWSLRAALVLLSLVAAVGAAKRHKLLRSLATS